MMIGFGIDLGAFGRRRGTAIVAARRSQEAASLYVLEGTVFDGVFAGSGRIREQPCLERELLFSLLGQGQVAVDVPLDLQKLPCLEVPTYNWELTLRPVDRAFQAMPPLASYLGHCVARFQCHFAELRNGALLETYPAASRGLCGCVVEEAFSKLDGRLSGDEKDAALCALVTVAREEEVLKDEDLDSAIRGKLSDFDEIVSVAPKNYRLLRRVPQIEKFERISLGAWRAEFDRG
jgi:hypothetical protein